MTLQKSLSEDRPARSLIQDLEEDDRVARVVYDGHGAFTKAAIPGLGLNLGRPKVTRWEVVVEALRVLFELVCEFLK